MGTSDSWLRLFESQFFDEQLALRYIHQKSGGIHEYLCNKLFQLPTEAIERILLQLCEIAAGTPSPSRVLQHTLVQMCSQTPILALKIYWLLQARLCVSSKDSEPVIRTLLEACNVAAVRATGDVDVFSHDSADDHRSSSGLCSQADIHHTRAATDGHNSNGTPSQIASTERLADLHSELGNGEGVTALVRASLVNLNKGGTGVVLPLPDEDSGGGSIDSSIGTSQHCFQPTLKFFDMLCNCAQGIVQLPHKGRHSELRQRLEACNRYLFSQAAIAKVLWPMGSVDERVIRIVPDRMVILQSREHAPFLLFVETLFPAGAQERSDFDPVAVDGHTVEHSGESCAVIGACNEDCDARQIQGSNAGLNRLSGPQISNVQGGGNRDIPEAGSAPGTAKTESIGDNGVSLSPSWVNIDGLELNSADAMTEMHSPGPAAGSDEPQRGACKKQPSWQPRLNSKDYLHCVYGDTLEDVRCRIQGMSPFGSYEGWNCHAVIVKSGDDCRQELLAMQLIEAFQRVFDVESLPLWLQPYKVLPTSSQTALIELLPDTMSVHSIKRCLPSGSSLADHFFRMFPKGTQGCEAAQRAFAQSLAAYSLICYLLQVKDRHNANIMLDQKGHIIHIDFGFMLSNSPGGVRFEQAPFKLTSEYMEVMGSDVHGGPSPTFQYFKNLWCAGHAAAAKHADDILQLVEIMQHSGLPCFAQGRKALDALKRRFNLRKDDVASLLEISVDAWTTRQYDYYQRVLNGIL